MAAPVTQNSFVDFGSSGGAIVGEGATVDFRRFFRFRLRERSHRHICLYFGIYRHGSQNTRKQLGDALQSNNMGCAERRRAGRQDFEDS